MWGKTEYMHITILRQHLHERPDDTFLRTEKCVMASSNIRSTLIVMEKCQTAAGRL